MGGMTHSPIASERLDRVFANVISEAEAKDRWCPWARVAAPDEGPTFNRLDAGRENGAQVGAILAPRVARCITRQCMAWRNAGPAGSGYCGAASAP